MVPSRDTIAAIATAPGRGGIGVVRVSGARCGEIYQAIIGAQPEPRIAKYVSFKSSSGEIIDKGIGIYYKSPSSYTGEDVLECHLHGNRIVLGMLLDEIITFGARLARPGEFTERAFLNNKLDLVQAEAVTDLIDSRSKKAARSAMQSLSGVFSNQVLGLREGVFKARALIEAALDFPEEEGVDVDITPAIKIINQNLERLNQLLSKAEAGRVLDQSPSVVIVGPPNVGKSSIINFLSGNDAAIVSSTAGTTRDIVRENVLLDGNAFTLIDTAGIRQAGDEIEQEGINRSYKALNQADLVLFVYDESAEKDQGFLGLEKKLPSGVKSIVIRNKVDLCGTGKQACSNNDIYVSAKTGQGMDVLVNKICCSLNLVDNEEDLIFARQRHIDALYSVKNSLKQALNNVEKKVALEVLAEDLRLALVGFDEITGKTITDDILGEIFSRFCIGK